MTSSSDSPPNHRAITAQQVREAIIKLLAGTTNQAAFLICDAATGHRLARRQISR
jgi:hypothetical protein